MIIYFAGSSGSDDVEDWMLDEIQETGRGGRLLSYYYLASKTDHISIFDAVKRKNDAQCQRNIRRRRRRS